MKMLRKILAGASASDCSSDRPHIHEKIVPSTARNASRLTSRDMRQRVYGFMRLISRSQPPNTFFCQNWCQRLRVLGDEVVDLTDDFESGEDQDPPLGVQLIAQRLTPRHQRDVGLLVRCRQPDEDREQHEDLDAVEEEHLAPHRRIAVVEDGLVHRRHPSARAPSRSYSSSDPPGIDDLVDLTGRLARNTPCCRPLRGHRAATPRDRRTSTGCRSPASHPSSCRCVPGTPHASR